MERFVSVGDDDDDGADADFICRCVFALGRGLAS